MPAATRQDIEDWWDEGFRNGATHLIVVCDTYDYDDYPIWVLLDEDVGEIVNRVRSRPLARIMEVYSYALDREYQLNEHRAWHLDQAEAPMTPEVIQEEP
jgi:hypothetical protein